METAVMKESLHDLYEMVSHLIKLPETKMSMDYDKEADVMYISFQRPQKATDSEMLDNGIIVRYKDDEVVGLTILDASKPRT